MDCSSIRPRPFFAARRGAVGHRVRPTRIYAQVEMLHCNVTTGYDYTGQIAGAERPPLHVPCHTTLTEIAETGTLLVHAGVAQW